MRKIIVTMWVTLDGFIAGPKNEMNFVTDIFDEAMGKYEADLVGSADTLILGRVTYESFAGAWPKVPDNPDVSEEEKAYARKLNAMRKLVFSRTLEKADWNNSMLLRVDEFQILVHPVILGAGKPFFKDIKDRVKLKLVATKTFPSGVVWLTYAAP